MIIDTELTVLAAMTRYDAIFAQLYNQIDPVTQVIQSDLGRIAWNTFLALVPLTLSFFLFYKPRSQLFCWSVYTLLGASFIVGIKKYHDGDLLQSALRIARSLWGVRTIFMAISLGLIVILVLIERHFWLPSHSASKATADDHLRQRSGQADRQNRSVIWWIGLLMFVAILPNAPYILTDIIHFYEAVRNINSAFAITLVIVPIYLVFIGIGWFAYVFSLLNIGIYLHRHQLERYISLTELSLHFLCAIGIYIGRFIRFNSWNLVTQPKQFLSVLPGELMGKFPLVVILLTFLIITILYAVSKPIVKQSPMYTVTVL
jgi:uncharacterized membrane protein